MKSILKLASSAFGEGEAIPALYTCDGADETPPLAISDVPASAKSLALVMDDPDASNGIWDHWLIWNIPPETTELHNHTSPIGIIGRNSWGRNDYGGPCPGRGQHRYQFKLYALNTTLNLRPDSNRTDLEDAMEGHILDQFTLTGFYQRPSH